MKKFDPKLFHSAVMTIARYRAKQTVKADIRAKGQKLAQYSCREIALLAEAELERNREEFITKAVTDCLTFPEFARYRAEIDVASVRNVSRNRTLPRRQPNAAYRQREYLTEKEVERLIEAARKRAAKLGRTKEVRRRSRWRQLRAQTYLTRHSGS
jgi:hypothetical protein